MRKWFRRIARWILTTVLVLLLLLVLDALALAYPYPVFRHGYRFQEFSVRSSDPLPAGLAEQTVAGLRARLSAMDDARPGEGCRIFVCGSQRLYSIFCFFARRPSKSQAFGLSVLNVAYLNTSRIAEMDRVTRGRLPGSRFDGRLDGAVAHEMAHFHMVERLGYRGALRLPLWASEGWADYQAQRAPARGEAGPLVERAGILHDVRYWDSLRPYFFQFYEWQLIVEYLAEVEGVGLEQLASGALSEEAARRRFSAWYHARVSKEPPEGAP